MSIYAELVLRLILIRLIDEKERMRDSMQLCNTSPEVPSKEYKELGLEGANRFLTIGLVRVAEERGLFG